MFNLIEAQLRLVLLRIEDLERKVDKMSQQIDNLTAQVEATKTVEQSAITLLNGLSAQIAALKEDPAALQKLADDLKAKGQELADAVTANTPAAP